MKAIEIFGEAKQTSPANNPVAKNANKAIGGGASGTHKNPKRAEAIPRKEKHKKQPELAEATKVDPDAKFDYDAWSKSGKKPREPGKDVKALAQQTRDANAKKKEQGVAEGATVAYTVLVVDPETYEKKKLNISALTKEHAKEKAEAKGYKVLRVDSEQGVAEGQLDEATARDVLLGLLDKFYADMKLPPRQNSHTGLLNIKSPGTRVWTRGDGTRHRDPGGIEVNYFTDDKKASEKALVKFWPWLLKQPGVKSIGQISGEFGSSPMKDAVAYKGLYFTGGQYGVQFGSLSRIKNPKSVWRHQPPATPQPQDDQGVAEAKRPDRPLPKTDLQVGDRVVADLRKEKDYPGGHQFRSGFVTRIGEKGVHIEPDDRGPHEWHPYKIVKKLGEGKSAREKWTAASNAREKAHNEREAEQAKLPAEKRLGSAVDALKKHLDTKVTEEQFCEDCGGSLAEHGKASRALCISSKPDSELGASNLASCKSQGLRAREGKKSHKLGKSPKSRVKVGGHKIKGKEYGGPLPDWS